MLWSFVENMHLIAFWLKSEQKSDKGFRRISCGENATPRMIH